MNQQLVTAYLRYYLGRLGWVGLVGVALIAGALSVWFVRVLPAQTAIADLEVKVAANRSKVAEVVAGGEHKEELTDEQKLLAFFASFPVEGQTPQTLNNLYKSAAHAGISLDTGEYAMAAVPGSRLKQYRVTLPVKGELIQILAFTGGVLKAAPNGALENAAFKREKIDDAQVDAKLVFQFFVNPKP